MPQVNQYVSDVSSALSRLEKLNGSDEGLRRQLLADIACSAVCSFAASLESAPAEAPPRQTRPAGIPFGVDLTITGTIPAPRNPPPEPAPQMSPRDLLRNVAILLKSAMICFSSAEKVPEYETKTDQLARRLAELLSNVQGVLRKQLQDCERESKGVLDLVGRREKLLAERKALEAQHADTLAEIDRLQTELNSLRQNSAAGVKEVETLNAELSRLHSDLKSLEQKRAESNRLTAEIETCEKELGNFEERKLEIESRANSIRQKRDAAKRLVESLEQQADDKVARKIQAIWQELPADAFDKTQ